MESQEPAPSNSNQKSWINKERITKFLVCLVQAPEKREMEFQQLYQPRKSAFLKKYRLAFLSVWNLILILLFAILFNKKPKVGLNEIETISCTSSLIRASSCGIGGVNCFPFITPDRYFYCPAGCQGTRAWTPVYVGRQVVQYQPLVIGSNQYYRPDSYICQAAIHAGVINDYGGVVVVSQSTESESVFSSSQNNGITSIEFNSTFPQALSFSLPKECTDCNGFFLPTQIILVLFLFALPFLEPSSTEYFSIVSFWSFMFWAMFSPDTDKYGEAIAAQFGHLIPYIATLYTFYTLFLYLVIPNPSLFPFELSILYQGGLWLGLYLDLISNFLPAIPTISFSSSMLRAKTESLLLLFGLFALILILIVYFIVHHRRQHTLAPLLLGYAILIPSYLILAKMTGLLIHLHHYMSALFLIPGVAIKTRPSIFLAALLVGWFSQGVIKYGFDSPFETQAQQAQSAGHTFNLETPVWTINATELTQSGTISWALPVNSTLNVTSLYPSFLENVLSKSDYESFPYTSYSLFLNDLEMYRGTEALWKFDNTSIIKKSNDSLYYFRVAAVSGGTVFDFGPILEVNMNGTYRELKKFSN